MPEKMAGQPLCMGQYRRMFSVARIPGEYEDELVEWDPREYRHIVCLIENKFYAFDVVDEYGNILDCDALAMYVVLSPRGRGATSVNLSCFAQSIPTGDQRWCISI